LMDLLYGYSLFRLITGQLDDDQMPDRLGATIARIARSGISSSPRTKKRRNARTNGDHRRRIGGEDKLNQ
jgi:hypothetical protein